MSLLKIISSTNREKEENILLNIYKFIDNKKSIIFSSGAGSGKTYALIESLKYIINNYGKQIKEHNQKIICITFTNVATEEVKDRLGNNDLVRVSTIHEKIWDFIKEHQKELVSIHKGKLEEEINKIKNNIKEKNEYERYQNLNDEQQENFTKLMLDKKDLFYQNYSENASNFRSIFQADLNDYTDILINIGNFKKIVSSIYKLENYCSCLNHINENKRGYKTIEYNFIYNRDQLHRMRISHDTLLEYGLKIIKKYDILKQIIIDQYPFVLIDEYQDTNEQVIKIMKILLDYANKIKHNVFIGYFGDTAQNIYDYGVGNNINNIHSGLKPINKEFNRRSTKEIIDVINKIRNDEIGQKSIYDDCEGGSVKIYSGSRDDIKGFIKHYISEWNITSNNKLHCLVLTNKTVATYTGFNNIYEVFKNTKYYKQYYDQLNTELLSDDLSKLGDIPILLFRIIELRNKLKNARTPVQDILSESIYKDMNIVKLSNFIEFLKQIDGNTLGDYIQSISTLYSKTDNAKYKKIVENLFDLEKYSYKLFQMYLLENLYPNLKDDDLVDANSSIQELLNIDLNEYDLWYKFILNEQNDKVVYHTYHGTKGLQFDNVIIIMENAFGKIRQYFNFFFQNIDSFNKLGTEDKIKYEQVRNLLYVSCSRTIKNLRVLYLDDVETFNVGIERIFGNITKYQT